MVSRYVGFKRRLRKRNDFGRTKLSGLWNLLSRKSGATSMGTEPHLFVLVWTETRGPKHYQARSIRLSRLRKAILACPLSPSKTASRSAILFGPMHVRRAILGVRAPNRRTTLSSFQAGPPTILPEVSNLPDALRTKPGTVLLPVVFRAGPSISNVGSRQSTVVRRKKLHETILSWVRLGIHPSKDTPSGRRRLFRLWRKGTPSRPSHRPLA
jgi:hypothetical protein